MTTLVRQNLDAEQRRTITVASSLRHPKEDTPDGQTIMRTLGLLWLHGVEPDWKGFYAEEHRHRVPLPTYPFDRKRYWVDRKQQAQINYPTDKDLVKNTNISQWFYIPSWKESVLLPPFESTTSPESEKLTWLVLVDQYGLSNEIAKRLEPSGRKIILVSIGEQFSRTGDSSYTLNPQIREDFYRLMESLKANNRIPARVLHFWTLTKQSVVDDPIDRMDESLTHGFYSLLYLAQAIGKLSISDPIHISVMSNNMHEVINEEILHPE